MFAGNPSALQLVQFDWLVPLWETVVHCALIMNQPHRLGFPLFSLSMSVTPPTAEYVQNILSSRLVLIRPPSVQQLNLTLGDLVV